MFHFDPTKKEKREPDCHFAEPRSDLSGLNKASVARVKYPYAYRGDYDRWLRSYNLKPSWESHSDMIEPYIWHGYRPSPTTFTYCLKSALHPTNETLNVWTHFLPGILIVWKTFSIMFSIENATEKLTYPLWLYSFGCCFVFFSSAGAHLLNCYSAKAQEFCFCLDYGSIAVYGLTLAISFQFMTCPLHCYGLSFDFFPISYIYLVLLVMLVAVHLTCRSRYPMCSYRYLFRFGPFAASYAVAGIPCVVRLLSTNYPGVIEEFGLSALDEEQCYLGHNHTSNYIAHLGFFIAAVCFVATRFPESVFPGSFDIFGHSHQWFHICVAIGMYLQHSMTEEALMNALQLRESNVLDDENISISVMGIFVPVALLVSFVGVFGLYTSSQVCALINANRNMDRKEK